MTLPLLTLRIQYEHDVVTSRQRTRQVAQTMGFDAQHQTRLATAVSEIARNAFCYAQGGTLTFSLEGATPPQLLQIVVRDEGPGIVNLEEVLSGRYRSQTGMGLGIIGAQRLMDQFRIDATPGRGTTVIMGRLLPRKAPLVTPRTLPKVLETLERERPRDLLDEFREQNRELLHTLEELRRRQEELTELNHELEDTNRGVVALIAELDEKADSLRRADDMKSRFLSNMSHEFRTPLNSVIALSRLLLDRMDGELTPEQELQVSYIRKSAESLSELVNDLLDLAKVEAGKTEVRPVEFEITSLFGALRGMMRPLLLTSALNLVFEDASRLPFVYSDEGKISQILRNFISNALKFTEAGEVRIAAEYKADTDTVEFRVRDTGIGIPAEQQERIFEEFTQVEHSLQRKVRGTGLGLPLSRKLAQLLGGDVTLESEPGIGSTFCARIPRLFRALEPPLGQPELVEGLEHEAVLVLEDDVETRLMYEKYLRGTRWKMVAARTIREGEAVLRHSRPAAIVLDIRLTGQDTWDFLARLKTDRELQGVPVIVATVVDDRVKALALGADEYLEKPIAGKTLRNALQRLVCARRTVLVVDDDDSARYLVKQAFGAGVVYFSEAPDGRRALEAARAERPDLIVLDLAMPDMSGFDTLRAMEIDADLAGIPVIVATSGAVSPAEMDFLRDRTLEVLSKGDLLSAATQARLESALREAGLDNLAAATTRVA